MKQRSYILLLLLLLFACREPFDFDYDELETGKIVIEGYLTDELMTHRIRVSESTRLGNSNGIEPRYITNANVSIIDDLGTVYNFSHTGSGNYDSNMPLQAVQGRTYYLEVALVDGRIFLSTTQSLLTETMEPIDLLYKVGEREVLLNDRIIKQEALVLSNRMTKSSSDRYYLWDVDEYFIKESDAGPSRTIEEELVLTGNQALRYCYVKDFRAPELYLKQDNFNAAIQGERYDQFIKYIDLDSRWEYEFVIAVRQLMLDQAAFSFWEKIAGLSNNSGGLFDPTPYSVSGNISHWNGEDDVLGYFGVYQTQVQRLFLTLADLNQFETFPPCQVTDSPGPQPCLDCRLWVYEENFGNDKPVWWP